MIEPALALIEFSSIAVGVQAADAMVKRAPIYVIKSGTVQPGKYLVLIGGEVADVEEALKAGHEVGGEVTVDVVYLPQVHPEVVGAIGGGRVERITDSLGIIETTTVAAIIQAADAGVKGAVVTLRELRMADGLGGKGSDLVSVSTQVIAFPTDDGHAETCRERTPATVIDRHFVPVCDSALGDPARKVARAANDQ